MKPAFYWGRLQPWCASTTSELAGPERWEPVAVHVQDGQARVLLLGEGSWFDLDDVELGEMLVWS